MNNYLEIIKKSSLFKNIEEEQIIPMLRCIGGYKKEYKKGQIIYKETDAVSEIGIVLKGKIQLLRYGYNGNKSILATIEESQMFGESYACANINKIPNDIVALQDCLIMFVDVKKITTSCCNNCNFHNQLIKNLLEAVATKNLLLNKKIEIISKRTTREKLLTYLYLQSKEERTNSFFIPYDRQSLADFLEVERSGLSVEISKLCKEGVIESNKNYFVLKKTINI